uniref:Pco130904 n=1 Tax=Arundo donax TaxID=35708 RepID=A0A0A9FB28_ARUDO
MLALESAATMTPLSKMKASVVVPFLFFTISLVFAWNPSKSSQVGNTMDGTSAVSAAK